MADVLTTLSQGLLFLTFMATLVAWLRQGGRERAEIAFMFGSLGVTTIISAFSAVTGITSPYLSYASALAISAHPYLMLRLVGQFRRVPRGVLAAAMGGMALSWIGLGYVQVYLPLARHVAPDAAPTWPIVPLIVYFVLGEGYAAYGLVEGAVRSAGVARRRLQWAAAGTGILALLIGAVGILIIPAVKSWDLRLVGALGADYVAGTLAALGFLCILSFYIAFSPPLWLRRAWRLAELESFLVSTLGRSVEEHAEASTTRLADVAVLLTGARGARVVARRPRGWVAVEAGGVASPAEEPASGPEARAMESREPVLDREGGFVVVPLATSERAWGVLSIRLERAPLFLEESVDSLRILTDQVARALQAESYASEQEEIRLRELRLAGDELRRQNEAIQEANRLKSEFLANMSHELRTPLNSIIGFAELLESGKVGEPDPTQKEFLGDILTSSRHLLQLINDVLDLAKVEAGRMEFAPEEVDLASLVEEVVVVVRALSTRKGIEVSTSVAPEVRRVSADPVRLKQVLFNYLSNAIKFTPEGGRVEVRATPQGPESFRLEVQDTGVGIRAEDIPKLFQEFQQLDSSMAKQQQGTGLGLALTKRLAEAQGGSVGVESAPGRGSTFSVTLPRVGLAGAVQARAVPVQNAGATAVLLVEDEALDRQGILSELGRQGYRVDVAANGRQALLQLAQRSYDAVVLDLVLPDAHGFDVLKAVRTRPGGDRVAVVIVTRLPKSDVRAAYPVQDILQKPVPAAVVAEALQRAGATPGTHRPVLVVDDDPSARKLMEAHLKTLGFRALLAADGRAGLEMASREPPAAVVLDLTMPVMDGFEFLERFRKTREGRDAPVLVWTNADLTAEERVRLEGNAQMIVYKAREGSADLVHRLEALLGRPRA